MRSAKEKRRARVALQMARMASPRSWARAWGERDVNCMAEDAIAKGPGGRGVSVNIRLD